MQAQEHVPVGAEGHEARGASPAGAVYELASTLAGVKTINWPPELRVATNSCPCGPNLMSVQEPTRPAPESTAVVTAKVGVIRNTRRADRAAQ